jgi:hypothetical protein
MIDFFNLPDKSSNTFYFFNSGLWIKPRGIIGVLITVIGAGGGGGGGYSAASGTLKSGGGGGASGGISNAFFPSYILPDILKIRIGSGGTSGSAGSPGSGGGTGGSTIVEVYNTAGSSSTYILVANGGGGGGAGVSASARGAAGTAAAAATSSSANFANLGTNFFSAGFAGAQSGLGGGSVGLSRVYGTDGVIVTGGAGGGGAQSASFGGGQITGANEVPTVLGGNPASNGFAKIKILANTGGGGGNGVFNAAGGNGGNGAIGSGGGGGGAGTTGGAGGRGGDGLVIITCW